MEPLNLNQKSLEKVVSQKALQMGSSFSCQISVIGFLCGVCLTTLFLAILTSFGTFQFGPISFSSISVPNSSTLDAISKSISFPYSFLGLLLFFFEDFVKGRWQNIG